MTTTLSTAQLTDYSNRIKAGGLPEAIKVYSELYAQGYNYAGWAKGVATGNTVTGVSALDFLSSTAMLGLGLNACKNLTPAQIDKIRFDMAQGYVDTLISASKAPGAGGVVNQDVSFTQTEAFHASVLKADGVSLDNWTLETPMSLIRATQGDAVVEKIWQRLRDTGGDGADGLIASAELSYRVGQLAFSSDPAVASAAQAWMSQTPGFANMQQISKAISAVITSFAGSSAADPLLMDTGSSIMSSVTSLSVTPTANGGATAVATIKSTTTGLTSTYSISTSPITSGSMTGRSLVTTTNTQTGQVNYQLQNSDGTTVSGNLASNGNISFVVNGALQVYKGGTYVGTFGLAGGASTLANGSAGNYTFNPTTGVITNTSNSIGGTYVNGYTSISTSSDGNAWTTPQISFADTNAANNADYAAWHALGSGTINKSSFENIVNSSTAYDVNSSLTLATPTDYSIYNPIGAFYESRSAGNDPALTISNKTFRVLNSAGAGLTAAQVAALDTNADGKVSGVELNGLYAWSDSNEDGVGQTTELTTLATALANAGLSGIRASDYSFYTSGNAIQKSAANSGFWRAAA